MFLAWCNYSRSSNIHLVIWNLNNLPSNQLKFQLFPKRFNLLCGPMISHILLGFLHNFTILFMVLQVFSCMHVSLGFLHVFSLRLTSILSLTRSLKASHISFRPNSVFFYKVWNVAKLVEMEPLWSKQLFTISITSKARVHGTTTYAALLLIFSPWLKVVLEVLQATQR